MVDLILNVQPLEQPSEQPPSFDLDFNDYDGEFNNTSLPSSEVEERE